MAALAEHRTSQRTQTAQHPGQPIAMSEKSSNFAPQFKKASHAHRTFIALPSHTRACVAAMRRSSSAKERFKKNKIIQD